MCGIAGILFNVKNSILKETIHKMTNSLAHRGPDAESFYIDDNIALGHRRLSVIDLSDISNQPFIDNSGRYIIVFNGEIYNFKEVKNKITNYNFRTNGDTEVILAAYLQWGENCLGYLNGMFAFSIWDKDQEALFIARDRMGVKPLYYFHSEKLFAFSSEIRSLLSSGIIERKVNKNAIEDYLYYSSVNAPFTIIKDIFQLMPGEFGYLKGNVLEKKYYWKIESKHFEIPNDYESIKRDVKRLLFESVERRLVSDVPLGAFLSGGIDSSAIVASMAEVSSQQVNTFSIVFKEDEFDESKYSNLISKKFNTKHTPILLNPRDFLKELPTALKAMDTPSGDGINTYLVSKVTKQGGITVALSGLGGDELFAGYPIFQQYKKINKKSLLWSLPLNIRSAAGNIIEKLLNDNKGARINEMIIEKSNTFANIYPILRKQIVNKQIKNIMNIGVLSENVIKIILDDRSDNISQLPIFSQVSTGELLSYTLNTLLKDTDQMSMASALEIREPFFDYKLVEYVMQIPDNFKYNGYPKSLLVESMGDLLPPEIVNRPKMGFVFPWKLWMKNELKSFCEDRIYRLSEREIFEKAEILKLWEGFINGDRKILWSYVWQLIVLENWLEENDIDT